jgi:Protein of unknown function (DUF2934)
MFFAPTRARKNSKNIQISTQKLLPESAASRWNMQTKLSPVQEGKERMTAAQIEERIRQRAYEIYVERGKEEGHAMEDWLLAKDEVLGIVKSSPRSHVQAA